MNSMRAYHCYVWSCMRACPSKRAVLQACSFSMEDLQSFHCRLNWLELGSIAALRFQPCRFFCCLRYSWISTWPYGGFSSKELKAGVTSFGNTLFKSVALGKGNFFSIHCNACGGCKGSTTGMAKLCNTSLTSSVAATVLEVAVGFTLTGISSNCDVF